MTKPLLYILFSIIFQTAFSQHKDIEELTRLNQEWLNSYIKKDSSTLNRIFADDFILVSPNGIKMTGSDIINNLYKQE